MKTRDLDRIRGSVDEREGQAGTLGLRHSGRYVGAVSSLSDVPTVFTLNLFQTVMLWAYSSLKVTNIQMIMKLQTELIIINNNNE